MIQFLLLAAWSLSGVGIAAALTPGPDNRFAWAPIAIFLGPLWVFVAAERPPPRPPTLVRNPIRGLRTRAIARPARVEAGAIS